MKATLFNIPADAIADWNSFHVLFRTTFGFPEWYGCNMDAWIDCMSYLRDPCNGLTGVSIGREEVAVLCISGADSFRKRCSAQFEALLDCSAVVNRRYLSAGEPPALSIILL